MTRSEFELKVIEAIPYLQYLGRKFTNFNNLDVDDLVQETIYKALKNFDKFTDIKVNALLGTIIRNEFINRFNRKKAFKYVDVFSGSDVIIGTTKNDGPDKLESETVEKFIKTKIGNPKVYNSFKLFLDDFKYKEIADELNIPIGSVKRNISIARELLAA